MEIKLNQKNNSNIPKEIQDYIERTEIRIKLIEDKQELRRQIKIKKQLEYNSEENIKKRKEKQYKEDLKQWEEDLEREIEFRNEANYLEYLEEYENEEYLKYIKKNDLIGA
jgi:hypothetical protein